MDLEQMEVELAALNRRRRAFSGTSGSGTTGCSSARRLTADPPDALRAPSGSALLRTTASSLNSISVISSFDLPALP